MSSLRHVRDYFNREAKRFDAIYESQKPWHQRLIDRAFRRVVIERFHLICNLAPVNGRWTVLDVGCGSGRYALAMIQAGATRVHGIDVAQSMIELARAESLRLGVADRCEFENASFLDFQSDERFDLVLATGYYDYLDDPFPHLDKMVALSRGRVILTFPKRWEFRVPIRKLRFVLAGGFVRFYSRAEIVALAGSAGVPPARMSLIDLGRDWVVVIRPDDGKFIRSAMGASC